MKNLCLVERFSKIGMGIFFLITAIGFMLSGITVLPVVGLLMAIPLFFISLYFFRAHLNKDCEIEETVT